MRKKLVAATGVAAIVAALAALGPGASNASSHREAPLIASDPAADNTDVYAFVSPERPGYVTMIANWIPFEEPDGGPNFYPFATDAAYRINVDSDGDAKPDSVFRWTFKNVDKRGNSTFLYNNGPVTSLDDENLLFKQTYTLESSFNGEPFKTRIKDAPVAPSRIGAASMPDYQKLRDQATIQLDGGWKLFAGQADDPFFLDLRVFDLLYGGDLSETGTDTLAGYNVNSIAIQVPFKDVALKGDAKKNPVVGIWSTTERSRSRVSDGPSRGDRVQVSRLGNPLVNEVVVPAGLKDAFNSISPDKDAGIPAVVKRVTNPELPMLIEKIYGVKAPATPRNDLVEIFLTGITTKAGGPIKADLNSQLNNKDVNPNRFRPSEMLRLNLSVPVAADPKRLGVLAGDLQGFPNGRRLTDDAVDIAVQAVEGAAQSGKLVDALAAGDKVDANDNAFGANFPYVALPNQGAVNAGRGNRAPAADSGSSPVDSGSSSAVDGGSSSAVDSGASDTEAAPDLAPASNSSMLNGSAVIFGVGGLGALLVMLAVWWLMKRRRRVSTPYDSDPTVRF
ncbi:DUF4331 domain-containing protein [Actinoplanes sp. LDG1-06]|uniref:DUF4331 domain-containing protein n=1 Tax=Paractinoplanes ovalisporus TaxID=2810368 RepID=A0ABS2AKB5_9ACTN|nr:DUF4331 domain-containing protein [Actinoplanes ovalisporus]MBM2620260.1 DUF4331 domain-containing protein [Actinoplanes ovalisporus]